MLPPPWTSCLLPSAQRVMFLFATILAEALRRPFSKDLCVPVICGVVICGCSDLMVDAQAAGPPTAMSVDVPVSPWMLTTLSLVCWSLLMLTIGWAIGWWNNHNRGERDRPQPVCMLAAARPRSRSMTTQTSLFGMEVLSVEELVLECKRRAMDWSGTKTTLIDRLFWREHGVRRDRYYPDFRAWLRMKLISNARGEGIPLMARCNDREAEIWIDSRNERLLKRRLDDPGEQR
jgi:hypothetical protein